MLNYSHWSGVMQDIRNMIDELDDEIDFYGGQHISCKIFIEQSITSLYSKKDNTYFEDKEQGSVECRNEMIVNLIQDLENNIQSYIYFLEPLEYKNYELKHIDDDKKTLMHFVKLTSHNPEVINTLFDRQIQKREIGAFILDVLVYFHGLDNEALYLSKIDKAMTELVRYYPSKIESIKEVLAEKIKQKHVLIFNRYEKELKLGLLEQSDLENELIQFYTKHFGVSGIEAFLEKSGFVQNNVLFEANLISFKMNVRAISKTHLNSTTFKHINLAIEFHQALFPKSYVTYDELDCFIVSVEDTEKYAQKKVQALLEMIAFMEPSIWQNNKYEQLMMMIEKINLDFSLDKDRNDEIKKNKV
jgi:hypothetical protein